MRAGSPRQRRVGVTVRVPIDVAKADLVLRAAGTLPCEGLPVEALATYDSKGKLKRLHARYPDHWRVTLARCKGGDFALSYAIKFVGKISAKIGDGA